MLGFADFGVFGCLLLVLMVWGVSLCSGFAVFCGLGLGISVVLFWVLWAGVGLIDVNWCKTGVGGGWFALERTCGGLVKTLYFVYGCWFGWVVVLVLLTLVACVNSVGIFGSYCR